MTQPLDICIGPTIRISREGWCLPYAGFFFDKSRNLSKIVLVLLSASVERFDVSRMRDFFIGASNRTRRDFQGIYILAQTVVV